MFDERQIKLIEAMPPGRCYLGAIYLLAACAFRDLGIAKVCHGIARHSQPPFGLMGHAWLELETLTQTVVFDPVTQSRYYEVGEIKPENVRKYSWDEVYKLVDETGHAGPWDEKLLVVPHANDDVAVSHK